MKNLSADERIAIIEKVDKLLSDDEISLGEAVKIIRVELFQMTQTRYAKLLKISEKTLRDIEKGNTDPRLSVLSKLLKAGGLRLSARQMDRRIR